MQHIRIVKKHMLRDHEYDDDLGCECRYVDMYVVVGGLM